MQSRIPRSRACSEQEAEAALQQAQAVFQHTSTTLSAPARNNFMLGGLLLLSLRIHTSLSSLQAQIKFQNVA